MDQSHESVIQVEFHVKVGGAFETIGMRNPKDIPNDIPGNDAYFMDRELKGIYEIGAQGYRWWYKNFYLIRLWWHRPKHHALAVPALLAGEMSQIPRYMR